MFGLFKSPKSGQQDVQQQPAPASIDPVGAGAYGTGNPGGSAPAGPSPWGMHEAPTGATPDGGLNRVLRDPGTQQENVQPQYARPVGADENTGGYHFPMTCMDPSPGVLYPSGGRLVADDPSSSSLPGIAGWGDAGGHGALGWPSEP